MLTTALPTCLNTSVYTQCRCLEIVHTEFNQMQVLILYAIPTRKLVLFSIHPANRIEILIMNYSLLMLQYL